LMTYSIHSLQCTRPWRCRRAVKWLVKPMLYCTNDRPHAPLAPRTRRPGRKPYERKKFARSTFSKRPDAIIAAFSYGRPSMMPTTPQCRMATAPVGFVNRRDDRTSA
jgi:hypothetical protein